MSHSQDWWAILRTDLPAAVGTAFQTFRFTEGTHIRPSQLDDHMYFPNFHLIFSLSSASFVLKHLLASFARDLASGSLVLLSSSKSASSSFNNGEWRGCGCDRHGLVYVFVPASPAQSRPFALRQYHWQEMPPVSFLLWRTHVCCDKTRLLSWQKYAFVVTNTCLSCKHFVATNTCRNKHNFDEMVLPLCAS